MSLATPPLHPLEAKFLNRAEQQLGSLPVPPAEYAVIRRVVAATGDLDFGQTLKFSSDALKSGAAALAARGPILVDIPAVQVGVLPSIQSHFANPVYCCADVASRLHQDKTPATTGFEILASRYPNAMVVVGQSSDMLLALGELIDRKAIYPALVIATPPQLIVGEQVHADQAPTDSPVGNVSQALVLERLQRAGVPYVSNTGPRGNGVVAIAILTALIEMTWQAYGQDPNTSLVSG